MQEIDWCCASKPSMALLDFCFSLIIRHSPKMSKMRSAMCRPQHCFAAVNRAALRVAKGRKRSGVQHAKTAYRGQSRSGRPSEQKCVALSGRSSMNRHCEPDTRAVTFFECIKHAGCSKLALWQGRLGMSRSASYASNQEVAQRYPKSKTSRGMPRQWGPCFRTAVRAADFPRQFFSIVEADEACCRFFRSSGWKSDGRWCLS